MLRVSYANDDGVAQEYTQAIYEFKKFACQQKS